MPDMRIIAARTAKHAHARVGVLAEVVRENPLLAGVAAIGFSVSFQTIAHLAEQHGMPGWPVLYPLGIDVGILAMFAEALHLIRQRRSDLMPRAIEWALSAFTVYVNVHGSDAGDWVGRSLHAVMPSLWVACLELVRHRRVGEAREADEAVPFRRWVASPWPSLRLWLRKQRDGVKSYPLALELEQARLYARDLVRAAPGEHRPPFSSLLRKRIRSGRLPEGARRAVRASLCGDYAPGWEDAVTEWVTTAMALPAHLAANLENTRAAIAAVSSAGTSVVTARVPAEDISVVTAEAPAETTTEVPAGATPVVTAKAAPAVTTRRRRVVPAKASNEDLADLIAEHAGDISAVTPYRVDKILKGQCNGSVGDKRLAVIADLVGERHGGARVVSMERRAKA